MSDPDFPMVYDHVAYATRDTDATVNILSTLGFTLKIYKQEIDKFNVFITKMVSVGNEVVEIVEPRGSSSVVSKLLDGNDATIYHACFKTQDFHGAQKKLKDAGAVTITKPMRIPYPISEEHKTYWASHMYHPNLGLFEITGPEKKEPLGTKQDSGQKPEPPVKNVSGLNGSWLVPLKRCHSPKLRLFCFPYGGGGATAFWSWQSELPEDTELWAARLPGRETRAGEDFITDADEVVTAIVDQLKELLDVKSVFYGHSLGAGLAFETAMRLRLNSEALPILFIASGRLPPHYAPTEQWADQPEEKLVSYLSTLGGMPSDLDDRMFRSVYLPVICADFRLDAALSYGHPKAFDFPITIVNGKDDPIVTEDQLEEWREYTNDSFKSIFVEGDHFFIHKNFSAFKTLLLDELARV